jgi:peptidyl-tRNA hydrolase
MSERRLKMICAMSAEAVKSMKGSRGKLGAQAGHAFLHAWWDASERFPDMAAAYRDSERAFKIVLVVDGADDLLKLRDAYQGSHGVSLVTDAGITVFEGPTVTCLGIGPIYDDECGEDLKGLKVL